MARRSRSSRRTTSSGSRASTRRRASRHVSNAKLLRLHATFSAVKEKFGTRAGSSKSTRKSRELEKRPKDEGYKTRLGNYPVPRLWDMFQSSTKRNAPKTAKKAPRRRPRLRRSWKRRRRRRPSRRTRRRRSNRRARRHPSPQNRLRRGHVLAEDRVQRVLQQGASTRGPSSSRRGRSSSSRTTTRRSRVA